jgi:hypothetical protein
MEIKITDSFIEKRSISLEIFKDDIHDMILFRFVYDGETEMCVEIPLYKLEKAIKFIKDLEVSNG